MDNISFEQFKSVASEFKLGSITTEGMNPLTSNLSSDCKDNLSCALASLKAVDEAAIKKINSIDIIKEAYALYNKVSHARSTGGRVFLCGCGATGRLSLAIETIARDIGITDIIGFMAGGDYALIKSVESFEDRMSYGARQLKELGFSENDILLGITEGGETSFVIGAVLEAQKISNHESIFLYCNPNDELIHLKRCADIIEDQNIHKLNLTVGAMALSGSTRMQATTVQMFYAGMICIYDYNSYENFQRSVQKNLNQLLETDYSFLENFIKAEAGLYQKGELLTYRSCQTLGISVLTDTTERSPTFSLLPFESLSDDSYSLSYLVIKEAKDIQTSWEMLLKRTPRGLNWGSDTLDISLDAIYYFDISEMSLERRGRVKENNIFDISLNSLDHTISFSLNEHSEKIDVKGHDLLNIHLKLKILLNSMSTAIMGRIGRFESNIMTWVKPSNLKLIDRATRYSQKLLEMQGKQVDYDSVLKVVIELAQDEKSMYEKPIVLSVVEQLS